MNLLKVCMDVRGAPEACRRTGPARQSAMGVAEVNTHGTACLSGFDSSLSARGLSQWMIPSSDAVRGPQAATQTPVKTTLYMDVVVSSRILPSHHCGVRAPRRKNTQRLEPARCCDCTLQFLFPQGSRHLPFPFSNARVEVGPTVMEG